MGRTIFSTAAGLCIVIIVVTPMGCRSFDEEKVRQADVQDFRQDIETRTAELIPPDEPLGLDDCVRIALKNNLAIKSSEIQSRIARLERKTAFASFLPAVSLDYEYTVFDPQLVRSISGFEAAMSDKRVREITWNIQMSIFNPATWLLYSMYSQGEKIADLITEYTRQMTVLQVTAGYFYCLSLEQYERTLESQVAWAETLQKEMVAMNGEGLVSDWQAGTARVLLLSRRLEQTRAARARRQATAELLTAMGLSPLAEISLKAEAAVEPVEGSLEDMVVEALLCHPQLRISDRQVAIEREKVKLAVAGFLPTLMGFAAHTDSSDSFLKYSNYWTAGLAATLSVFDGFASVNEYKAARQQREKSYIEREQTSLAVMLEVIRAYLAVETAREQMRLADSALEVASQHFTEIQQKWREGLIRSSDILEITVERDNARMHAITARFQYDVSVATLLNAMGKTKTDFEEPAHDGQS